ncbi:unnamed protein product [Mortierella alpina]
MSHLVGLVMDRAPTRQSARLASKASLKAREAEYAATHAPLTPLTASSSKASAPSRGRKRNISTKDRSKNKDDSEETAHTRQGSATKSSTTKSALQAAKSSTKPPQKHKAAKASKKRPRAEDQTDPEDASPKKKRRSKPKKTDSSEAQPMDLDQQQQQQQQDEEASSASIVPPRPINPKDPCERLPTELWHQVLAQLPLSQAATTSLVSKTWLAGALAWPKWRHLCEDLKLGKPKRKFKTYMSIVCLHSYYICDLCYSYSTGFRKCYGSQLPLPVDIVVKRLDWDKEPEKAEENVEKAESTPPAQKQADAPQQNVTDATPPVPSSQPPPPGQQTDLTPIPVKTTGAASSDQSPPPMPLCESSLFGQAPPSVHLNEPASSNPPPSQSALQEQLLADSHHTQSEKVQPTQPEQVAASQPEQIHGSQQEQSQAIQPEPSQAMKTEPSQAMKTEPSQAMKTESSQAMKTEPSQVTQPEQVNHIHIPEGVLDAGVAEQMRHAISQLILASKLSQQLAASFRAQVKTSAVQPDKHPTTAPQAGATANGQSVVAKAQVPAVPVPPAAPAPPAKPAQPVERWNLCHSCRLQYYRRHPQPSRPVSDAYGARANGKKKKQERMCKTRGLCHYGLSTADIRDLDYIERRNPHHRSWNPMMLYSIRDLQKRALIVHGGWVGVDAFKNGINKKRRMAFNARSALWKLPSKSKKRGAQDPQVVEESEHVENSENVEEDGTTPANIVSPAAFA